MREPSRLCPEHGLLSESEVLDITCCVRLLVIRESDALSDLCEAAYAYGQCGAEPNRDKLKQAARDYTMAAQRVNQLT